MLTVEIYAEKQQEEVTETRLEFILAAALGVLMLAFIITLVCMMANIRRFKRKLKAATLETHGKIWNVSVLKEVI